MACEENGLTHGAEVLASEHFTMACLPPEESPDPRCRTQDALQRVAAMIRDDPTVPAVVEAPLVPDADALREDCAVELPRKHCAFRGCAFRGQTQEDLDRHLADAHADVLVPVAKLLEEPCDGKGSHCSEAGIRAAYHEAIANVVRRGAPLATWSTAARSTLRPS